MAGNKKKTNKNVWIIIVAIVAAVLLVGAIVLVAVDPFEWKLFRTDKDEQKETTKPFDPGDETVPDDFFDDVLDQGSDDKNNVDSGELEDDKDTNTDDENPDDGNTDNDNTDNDNTDNDNTDNSNTDNGNTDNGNTDNGNTDNGNTNNGNTGNGTVDVPDEGLDVDNGGDNFQGGAPF